MALRTLLKIANFKKKVTNCYSHYKSIKTRRDIKSPKRFQRPALFSHSITLVIDLDTSDVVNGVAQILSDRLDNAAYADYDRFKAGVSEARRDKLNRRARAPGRPVPGDGLVGVQLSITFSISTTNSF